MTCGKSLRGLPLYGQKSKPRMWCSTACYAAVPKSEQTRRKIGAAGRGRVQSEETKRKRAESNRGKKRTPEQIRNILKGRAEYLARGPSDETREKMSRAKLGRFRGPESPHWKPDRELMAARRAFSRYCYATLQFALELYVKFPDVVIPETGWTPRQLREHLELQFQQGMTWENRGRTGWHVDHIRHIASFPIGTSMSEVNALSNLRPLWAVDNLRREKFRG